MLLERVTEAYPLRIGLRFNGHPPLGVNATPIGVRSLVDGEPTNRFNGHPPLGVNATWHSIIFEM